MYPAILLPITQQQFEVRVFVVSYYLFIQFLALSIVLCPWPLPWYLLSRPIATQFIPQLPTYTQPLFLTTMLTQFLVLRNSFPQCLLTLSLVLPFYLFLSFVVPILAYLVVSLVLTNLCFSRSHSTRSLGPQSVLQQPTHLFSLQSYPRHSLPQSLVRPAVTTQSFLCTPEQRIFSFASAHRQSFSIVPKNLKSSLKVPSLFFRDLPLIISLSLNCSGANELQAHLTRKTRLIQRRERYRVLFTKFSTRVKVPFVLRLSTYSSYIPTD